MIAREDLLEAVERAAEAGYSAGYIRTLVEQKLEAIKLQREKDVRLAEEALRRASI